MIGFRKVFVDTAPFIYFIEKDANNPQYHEKVKSFLNMGMIMTRNSFHL